jgi:hypothetical protein
MRGWFYDERELYLAGKDTEPIARSQVGFNDRPLLTESVAGFEFGYVRIPIHG